MRRAPLTTLLAGMAVVLTLFAVGCSQDQPPVLDIGIPIPTAIIFEGRTYVSTDEIVATIRKSPTNLSRAGGARSVDDLPIIEPTDGQGGWNLEVYSIKGTDPKQAVAVMFTVGSDDGPYFAWFKYEIKE